MNYYYIRTEYNVRSREDGRKRVDWHLYEANVDGTVYRFSVETKVRVKPVFPEELYTDYEAFRAQVRKLNPI